MSNQDAIDQATEDLRVQFVYNTGAGEEQQIETFMHCQKCVIEWKKGLAPNESPMTYARLSIGIHPEGLQVWCNRHEMNVAVIKCQIAPAATGTEAEENDCECAECRAELNEAVRVHGES